MKIKNIAKNSFLPLLALLLVMSLPVMAFAVDSTVTFQDGKLIAFKPGRVYTDSDLFDNFKGVMPGDTRTEEVTIHNQTNDCDYIKVYLRVILHDEDGNPISHEVLAELRADERREAVSELEYMYEFLSQLSMKVRTGDNLIYEASPDRLDGLAENIYLGSLRKGDTVKLDVDLTVPIELGNAYSNRSGEVDWVFVIEGFDEPTPPSDDNTMLTVRKVWVDNGIDRPDGVTVQLLGDGKVRDEVYLNQNNNWAYTWDNLRDDYTWSAVEVDVPDGYEATYTIRGNITTITNSVVKADVPDEYEATTGENTATVTNTEENLPPSPPDPPEPVDPVDLTVVKKWDDNGKDGPDSVKVTLYDGDTAIESVWLGAWNNWSYSWRNLDGNGNWQVIETNIPGGYTPSYSYRNGVVTVTNTATLIQTGQLSWPIPVLGGLGFLLIAYGFIVMTKKRKNKCA